MGSSPEVLARWLSSVGEGVFFDALGVLLDSAVVFAVDAERRVLWWSEGAERILGWSPSEVVGEHCLKSNRCQTCMAGCGIERHGSVRNVPLEILDKQGRPVSLRKTAHAFYDEHGDFAGGLEVLVPDAAPPGKEAPTLPGDVASFHGLKTRDPRMLEAIEIVRNVSDSDVPVLLRGESGTGKELVARGLHLESRRARKPFLAVNCAAFVPTLLESELFGHRKGAFSGADRNRPGLLEQADGGTLFLDEVAELPIELQPKLLRVLQDQTFVPVGGVRAKRVDVRIVSATHKSLRAEVAAGLFREDLMFRLRVVPVFLPALRERPRDIELMLRLSIARKNAEGRRRVRDITPDAMRALLDHAWPGNVRELQNVVEYAFAVGRGPEISLAELPPEFREAAAGIAGPGAALRPARHAASVSPHTLATRPGDERARLAQALEQAGGHPGRAAELVGMSRTTFWRRRKKYDL